MLNHLPRQSDTLRLLALSDIRKHLRDNHDHLADVELAQLQQAFIRLSFRIDPHALNLFRETSLVLQSFVRRLLLHYILERDLVLGDDSPALDPTPTRTQLDQLRYEHQLLQEKLSDLQSLTHELHKVAPSPASLRITQALSSVANHLHEQIHDENRILFPRSSRS